MVKGLRYIPSSGEEHVAAAIQVKPYNLNEVERFVGGDLEVRTGGVVIAGPDGVIHALADYWILKHEDGRYSACSPEDFTRFYIATDLLSS
jgi:hypothetical protein